MEQYQKCQILKEDSALVSVSTQENVLGYGDAKVKITESLKCKRFIKNIHRKILISPQASVTCLHNERHSGRTGM